MLCLLVVFDFFSLRQGHRARATVGNLPCSPSAQPPEAGADPLGPHPRPADSDTQGGGGGASAALDPSLKASASGFKFKNDCPGLFSSFALFSCLGRGFGTEKSSNTMAP